MKLMPGSVANILDAVGNTPLVKLNKIGAHTQAEMTTEPVHGHRQQRHHEYGVGDAHDHAEGQKAITLSLNAIAHTQLLYRG